MFSLRKMQFALLALCLAIPQLSNAQTPTSWEPLGGAGAAKVTVVATTPAAPSIAIAGYTNGNVYFTSNSQDAAPNWTQVDDKTGTPYDSLPNNTVTAIAIGPRDTQTYYVGFAGCHYPGKLWKTGNGGETFIPLENAPFCDISSISINPIDPSIVYLIANKELYVSEDFGTNWSQDPIAEPISPPLAAGDRISAITSAKNIYYNGYEDILVGTVNGDVWMTLDAGNTWTRLDEIGNPYATDLPESMVTSLVFDDRLSPPAYYVSYYREPMDANMDALWSSMTGGEFFNSIYTDGLPGYSGVGMISINPAYFGTLYATTGNMSTITNAFKSENNGDSWSDGCTCDTGCAAALTAPVQNFGTTNSVCFAIEGDINGWTAWNTQRRDIVVNGVDVQSGGTLPEKINDRYYVYFTDGDYSWAGWTLW